jgi:hypothetical protein
MSNRGDIGFSPAVRDVGPFHSEGTRSTRQEVANLKDRIPEFFHPLRPTIVDGRVVVELTLTSSRHNPVTYDLLYTRTGT